LCEQAYDGTAKSAFQTVTLLKKIVNDPGAAEHVHEQQMEQSASRAAAGEGGGEGGGFGGVAKPASNPMPARVPIDAAASLQKSGKLQVLLSLLREVKARTSDRFVLISNFTTTLSLFEAVLNAHGLPYKRLDGSMPPPKRQECIDTFNADPTYFAFLLSSKAGGCGVTLTGANRLVLFDPDWNPAVDNQALARVWRSGQRKACYVYRFFATGTLEEVCYERQCSKEGLAGEIVDGDGGESLRFSEAELKSLFSPKFETLSLFHERSKCRCCHAQAPAAQAAPPATTLVPTDQRGYTHLLPGSAALAQADPCLARTASVSPVSLCYCRVTDLTSDESVEAGVARGFPDLAA
jgi:SNF2 family DNA or RNA helicase